MVVLKMMRMTSQARLFQKAHEDDACFDMYALEEYVINPYETILIHTGIKIELPKGYEGIIRPRSGMCLSTALRIANSPGTIDSGYRGEVCVIMTNTGHKLEIIKKHDRIAQFTVKKVQRVIVVVADELDDTERGEDGFGSTGV